MTTKVGINGFGRIGRLTLRAIEERQKQDLEIVAVNGHSDSALDAHLLKWDSTYGRYPGQIESGNGSIIIDGKSVAVLSERNPEEIPWSEYGVELVIEATGAFTKAQKAAAHLKGSVRKVVISAGCDDADVTLVMGVNEEKYRPQEHRIISNASCTTNCVAPVVKTLHETFGIIRGMMTTVHACTNDQRLLDGTHKDLRRARAAGTSMIPTKTGAARMIGVVIPELSGKIDGMSIRVPTPAVSAVDLVVTVNKKASKEEVNQALKNASQLKPGIIEYCDEQLVSVDFKGNPASCIIDAPSTMVIDTMIKIIAWYDNEWGYCCRLADLAAFVAL